MCGGGKGGVTYSFCSPLDILGGEEVIIIAI